MGRNAASCHDGVTDRRRWESALFLKVRDEIQTGNLAIDGAKNFGRFEAFFLPAARWEQVREAFWARTGFPVDPAAAVEQLKARLSGAFDRFLEGVADNRQVAFDDDGWRLKTDAAEQPDPAQSDRLADDGREGIIDLEGELWGEVFEPLKDTDVFRCFRMDPELDTIVWPTGADLAPEFLYERAARGPSSLDADARDRGLRSDVDC